MLDWLRPFVFGFGRCAGPAPAALIVGLSLPSSPDPPAMPSRQPECRGVGQKPGPARPNFGPDRLTFGLYGALGCRAFPIEHSNSAAPARPTFRPGRTSAGPSALSRTRPNFGPGLPNRRQELSKHGLRRLDCGPARPNGGRRRPMLGPAGGAAGSTVRTAPGQVRIAGPALPSRAPPYGLQRPSFGLRGRTPRASGSELRLGPAARRRCGSELQTQQIEFRTR